MIIASVKYEMTTWGAKVIALRTNGIVRKTFRGNEIKDSPFDPYADECAWYAGIDSCELSPDHQGLALELPNGQTGAVRWSKRVAIINGDDNTELLDLTMFDERGEIDKSQHKRGLEIVFVIPDRWVEWHLKTPYSQRYPQSVAV